MRGFMGHNRFPMLLEGRTNPFNTPSDKQIEAAEIVDSQQDAFEVVPPDHRRDVVCRLPDGRRDLPEHGQAVIVLQCAAGVMAHAARHEYCVVVVQQRPFHSAPSVWIPMHRHHVREVVRSEIKAPAIPIEEADLAVPAIARQETIPYMRIALHYRDIAMGMVASEQTRRSVKQSFVKVAPLAWEAVADAIGEAGEPVRESRRLPGHGSGV